MSQSIQSEAYQADTPFVTIPGTSLRVSRVGLGTWAMGGWMWGGRDDRESLATLWTALNQGINLVDTAPVYGCGVSEGIVGKAIANAGLRSQVVIATKTGLEWRDGKVYRNATRQRILREVEESLRRLRTDYIDIYQVHWPDTLVPIGETAETMRTLYEQGKIRAIGVCNFSIAQIERFRQVAPLHVVQSPYNLFERGIEADILPYCRANRIVTLGYGALCRGLLSGRMRLDSRFEGDDLRGIDPKFRAPRFAQYLAAVQQLDELARERFRLRVLHLAVHWALDQGIDVALCGARRPEHLMDALGTAGWPLDAATRAQIDRILHETVAAPIGPEFMAPPQRFERHPRGVD